MHPKFIVAASRPPRLGRVLWGDGQTRIGAALSQRIDTPTDTHIPIRLRMPSLTVEY